jgi:hypothetical protein
MDENDKRMKAGEEKDLSTDDYDKSMDENDERIKAGKEREKSSPGMDAEKKIIGSGSLFQRKGWELQFR